MTAQLQIFPTTPAKAGAQYRAGRCWTPAFAAVVVN